MEPLANLFHLSWLHFEHIPTATLQNFETKSYIAFDLFLGRPHHTLLEDPPPQASRCDAPGCLHFVHMGVRFCEGAPLERWLKSVRGDRKASSHSGRPPHILFACTNIEQRGSIARIDRIIFGGPFQFPLFGTTVLLQMDK